MCSTVYWVDSGIPLEKFLELKPYQKINHYPGIGEITRKDLLARNMQKYVNSNLLVFIVAHANIMQCSMLAS